MNHRIATLFITAALVAGCSFPNVISPYKLDIPQGNTVTADQVARLKIGMTRSQVRFVLGTPLLTDPFHINRWDYVFTDARNGEIRMKKAFFVVFENDKLAKFEGETLPAVKPVAPQAASAPANTASAPSAKKD